MLRANAFYYSEASCNCTWVELKLIFSLLFVKKSGRPVIAPEWNWNKGNSQPSGGLFDSCNCTWVELKWVSMFLLCPLMCPVIAPEWNWNIHCFPLSICQLRPVIAPEWNWNLFFRRRRFPEFLSCNCTWVELKCMDQLHDKCQQGPVIAPEWNWNKWGSLQGVTLIRPVIAPEWNWNVLGVP